MYQASHAQYSQRTKREREREKINPEKLMNDNHSCAKLGCATLAGTLKPSSRRPFPTPLRGRLVYGELGHLIPSPLVRRCTISSTSSWPSPMERPLLKFFFCLC